MKLQVLQANTISLNNAKYTLDGMNDVLKDWHSSSSRPVFILDRSGDRREVGFVSRGAVSFDTNSLILSVEIPDSILSQYKGSSLVPSITVDKEYRSNDNTHLIIDVFQINGFLITPEKNAFPALNSVIK